MKTPASLNPDRRKGDTQPLKETLNDLIRVYQLQGKLNETKVIADWGALVGKAVAQKTTQLYFHNRKLFVRIDSAPLRHQLYLSRTEYMQRVNEYAGTAIIDEVVFL